MLIQPESDNLIAGLHPYLATTWEDSIQRWGGVLFSPVLPIFSVPTSLLTLAVLFCSLALLK